ncbi:MAG: hypothetical protein ACRD5K_06105 [Candidatus Acidiferrales bacterium]
MRKIKKFEPLSVMRISAIAYGAMGLLEGAIFSVMFSLIPLADPQHQNMPRRFGVMFGGLAIVFLPVVFAIMGAISGGLGAVIYNVSAHYVGGIAVEVE